jgi:hypothetical protein
MSADQGLGIESTNQNGWWAPVEPRSVPTAASVVEDPRSSTGESVHSNLSPINKNRYAMTFWRA